MSDTPNKPVKEFKFGAVKAAIFKNENGYSVNITRSYLLPPDKREPKDDNGWRETSWFNTGDLASVEMSAKLAFAWIGKQLAEE